MKQLLALKQPLRNDLYDYANQLMARADDMGVPQAFVFHNTDQYPEFDDDPYANYLTGLIQGVAITLGVDAESLLTELLHNGG